MREMTNVEQTSSAGRLRCFLLMGLAPFCVAGTAGCGFAPNPAKPTQSVKFYVNSLPHPVPGLPAKARIQVDGKQVAEVDLSDDPDDSKRIYNGELPSSSSSVAVLVCTPDGWTDFAGPSEVWGEDPEVHVRVPCRDIGSTNVWIDNRDHDEIEIAYGLWSHRFAKNSRESLAVPSSANWKDLSLKLDGKEIGPLGGEVTSGDPKRPACTWLVDSSAKHKYIVTFIEYGERSPFYVEPAPLLMTARHLHRLPVFIDYVFNPAPERVNSRDGAETRTKLMDWG
jgi:hypothetical protein